MFFFYDMRRETWKELGNAAVEGCIPYRKTMQDSNAFLIDPMIQVTVRCNWNVPNYGPSWTSTQVWCRGTQREGARSIGGRDNPSSAIVWLSVFLSHNGIKSIVHQILKITQIFNKAACLRYRIIKVQWVDWYCQQTCAMTLRWLEARHEFTLLGSWTTGHLRRREKEKTRNSVCSFHLIYWLSS